MSDLVEHATTRRRFELFLDNNQLSERSTRRELIAIIVTCIAAKTLPIGRVGYGRLGRRGRRSYRPQVSQIAILDLSKAISPKRCKIGAKLALITNKKSHIVFAYPDIRITDIRIYPLILRQPKIRIS